MTVFSEEQQKQNDELMVQVRAKKYDKLNDWKSAILNGENIFFEGSISASDYLLVEFLLLELEENQTKEGSESSLLQFLIANGEGLVLARLLQIIREDIIISETMDEENNIPKEKNNLLEIESVLKMLGVGNLVFPSEE